MKQGKYAYRESFNSHYFDYKTNKYLFTIEYAQTTENGWTSEPTYARGKGGAKVVVFNGTKESTYKMTTQLIPMRVLAMYAGTEINTGKHNVYKGELLEVSKENYSASITVTAGATATGTVTVNLNGTNHAVSVTASDSATAVATAMASTIDAHANYTATASGAVVTVVPTSASTPLSASVNGASTGVTATAVVDYDAFVTLSKTPIDANHDGVVDGVDVGIAGYDNNVETDGISVLSVDTDTRKVTLDTSSGVTDTVRAVYQWQTTTDAHRIDFDVNKFPNYVKIVSDTLFADENGDMAAVQEIKYKAKLKPNFTLAGATTGDPSNFEMEFDLFQAKVDGKDLMATMTFYEDQ